MKGFDLKQLLSESLSYPSGDNCQPFKFAIVGPNTFEIYHDVGVAKHRLNANHLASYLSFGTLLETLSLVAGKMATDIEIDFHLESEPRRGPLQKWATVRCRELHDKWPSPYDEDLFAALKKREVNRSLYQSEGVLPGDVSWLLQEAEAAGLTFTFQSKVAPGLKTKILKLEEEAWKDSELTRDLLKWVRFDSKTALESRDGLTWKSLILPFTHKPLLKLFSKFPKVYKFVAKLGATKGNRVVLKNQIEHSTGFGWFSLSSHHPIAIVNAGRCAFRMWLYLNGRGYAFQPLTICTLPIYQNHFDLLPADWSPRLKRLYPEILEAMRETRVLPEGHFPVWGFRTGRAAPLPDAARCLRKNLEQLLVTSLRVSS